MSDTSFTLKEMVKDIKEDTKKIPAIEEHLKTLNGKVAAQEKRIQVLEQAYWKLVGAMAVAIFVVELTVKVLI
jgi:uncharacterized membrane protein